MTIKSRVNCNWCEKQLIDGDYVFCNICYSALQDRISELKEGMAVKDSTRKLMEGRITELEEEISALKQED